MNYNSALPPLSSSLLPSRDKGAYQRRGNRGNPHRAQAAVVRGTTRNAVATPQSLVVLTADTPKAPQELARRARAARADPRTLYGPPTDVEQSMSVFKGMVGLCSTTGNGGFRAALGNSSTAQVHGNMAGLSREERLHTPCVIQTTRDAADPNAEDKATLVVQGVQSVHNTGGQQIPPGVPVIADPNPYMVEQDGAMVPGVQLPGIDRSTLFVQLRPLTTATLHSYIRAQEDAIRIRMGNVDFGMKLSKALLNGDPKAIYDLLEHECTQSFEQVNMPVDMPMRDLIRVFAPWQLVQFICIPGCIASITTPQQRSRAHVLVLNALRLELIRHEQTVCRIFQAFERSLPHGTEPEGTLAYARTRDTSIHSDKLRDLISVDFVTGGKSNVEKGEAVLAAAAHLNLHYASVQQRSYCAMTDYLNRFLIGKSLTGANKGQQFDILMGAH